VASELSSAFDAEFAVLTANEVSQHVSVMENGTPPDEPGIRWTPGLVFAVRRTPVAKLAMIETSNAKFQTILNVIGAWKRDKLTDSKVLAASVRDRGGG